MKVGRQNLEPVVMSQEFIDLLLDEAERALLDVEARTDEPDRRFLDAEPEAGDVADLRLAMAELADAFPGIHYDLETISDRMRTIGASAAGRELHAHPHVGHLVRMSLEVFFRQFPSMDSYAADFDRVDEVDDEGQSPFDIYDAYRQLLTVLKERLS